MSRCADCGDAVNISARFVVRQRQNGQQVWTIAHECGDGPRQTTPLGEAPVPTSHVQTFVHHVCHGLLMHYRLVDVVSFAWRNRTTFDPTLLD